MSLSVALFWHQHQPYYKDLATGEFVLPWVRLHGLKDYYGMARLLEEFPGLHCTVNLVPCLVAQLQDYVQQGASDPFLRVSRIPAADLTAADVQFLLDHFFMAQWERMIRPQPRYRELLELRRFGGRSAESAAQDFGPAEIRDLQVWFNLVWFHPVSYDESELLRGLRAKGRNFTEEEKDLVLREQEAVLRRVLPLHAELARRGQLELTATPFYHPILPLLVDMQSAREAMPGTALPNGWQPLSEDAEAQVGKAVEYHRQIFGRPPTGMWPAEGSVSPALIPLLARHGIEWLATDEEILSASLSSGLRGDHGQLERPDCLYNPWRCEWGGAGMNLVFRDHHLSDLIGFQYQSWDWEAAADDFLRRLEENSRRGPGEEARLAAVILDGENCWEHYPEQGVGFLRALYRRLQDGQRGIRSTGVTEYLRAHPPARRLERLFSGSWINHDFYIWIGHADDRKGWEYVFRAREDLVRETHKRRGQADQAHALAQAWEELYIAEGSDWYWWYGDDHTSGYDDVFDRLFRTHLKNIYRFLGLQAPYFLDESVRSQSQLGRYSRPLGSLAVTLDCRVTSYFEWRNAGKYLPAREGGVMTASSAPLIAQICFGFDRDNLLVRVDPRADPSAGNGEAATGGLRRVCLRFAEPRTVALALEFGLAGAPGFQGDWAAQEGVLAAWDECLEVRVPFAALGAAREKPVAFYVETEDADGMVERYPRTCALVLQAPAVDVEEGEWCA